MSFDIYATLLNKRIVVLSQRTPYVAVDCDHFTKLLEPHIAQIAVHADWYLAKYPDVKQAVIDGDFSSARDHYIKVGYFEHRMPHPIDFDEEWYLAQNPDVSDAVSKGIFESGEVHFEKLGFREGRFPQPGFRLASAERNVAAQGPK